MAGSPSAIITLGYGNGTFNGSPSLVVTSGFGSATVGTITITGPSTLVANVPRNYTYTPDDDATGVTVTPTTDGTGTFDPASDTFVGSTPLVFEYTATDFADSPHTLGSTDDGGLTNGTKVVTVLEVAPADSPARMRRLLRP